MCEISDLETCFEFELPGGDFWEEERQSGRGLQQDIRLKPKLTSEKNMNFQQIVSLCE